MRVEDCDPAIARPNVAANWLCSALLSLVLFSCGTEAPYIARPVTLAVQPAQSDVGSATESLTVMILSAKLGADQYGLSRVELAVADRDRLPLDQFIDRNRGRSLLIDCGNEITKGILAEDAEGGVIKLPGETTTEDVLSVYELFVKLRRVGR